RPVRLPPADLATSELQRVARAIHRAIRPVSSERQSPCVRTPSEKPSDQNGLSAGRKRGAAPAGAVPFLRGGASGEGTEPCEPQEIGSDRVKKRLYLWEDLDYNDYK